MEVLAERLKWLREKHRYAQKEVAGKIGVTASGYQKMEYNEANPKIDTLIKIAEMYSVSTDFLLGLSDEDDELLKIKHDLIIAERIFEQMQYEFSIIYTDPDSTEKEKNYINNKLKDAQSNYANERRRYVKYYLELPKPNPINNEVFSDEAPFKVSKAFSPFFGTWEIGVYNNVDNRLLIIDETKTEEEADELGNAYAEKYGFFYAKDSDSLK